MGNPPKVKAPVKSAAPVPAPAPPTAPAAAPPVKSAASEFSHVLNGHVKVHESHVTPFFLRLFSPSAACVGFFEGMNDVCRALLCLCDLRDAIHFLSLPQWDARRFASNASPTSETARCVVNAETPIDATSFDFFFFFFFAPLASACCT